MGGGMLPPIAPGGEHDPGPFYRRPGTASRERRPLRSASASAWVRERGTAILLPDDGCRARSRRPGTASTEPGAGAWLATWCLHLPVDAGGAPGEDAPHVAARLTHVARNGVATPISSTCPRGGPRPGATTPLLLFLHGGLERGDDLARVRRQALPRRLDRRPAFPFAVVSPQCHADSTWADHLPFLEGLLDEVVEGIGADPARVVVTGISMGGAGAFLLGARCPGRFAAVVPICAAMPRVHGWPHAVTALRDVPVWAFHGDRDEVVPMDASVTLVRALTRAGGPAKPP